MSLTEPNSISLIYFLAIYKPNRAILTKYGLYFLYRNINLSFTEVLIWMNEWKQVSRKCRDKYLFLFLFIFRDSISFRECLHKASKTSSRGSPYGIQHSAKNIKVSLLETTALEPIAHKIGGYLTTCHRKLENHFIFLNSVSDPHNSDGKKDSHQKGNRWSEQIRTMKTKTKDKLEQTK